MIRLKNNVNNGTKISLTPLIDMVFLLIIFFLLTTRFITEEGISVKLPQARSTTPQTQREITVYVTKEGRIFIGNRELTLPQLYHELRILIGSDKNKLVVIKADREVILNKVVKVMDIAKTAGAAKLCIAARREEYDE
ncbi:MAG: biopolymer transporter ExbD [Candidatus Desulfofervidus auxilii]|nr:biopolymer transporter ExbD [Candidatus Desulfofervidus auxilii]